MKVYCRFAPPTSVGTASHRCNRAPDDPSLSAMPLVIEARTVRAPHSSPPHVAASAETAKEEVRLLDPLTGSSACFKCDGVFLPHGLVPTLHNGGASSPLESSLPLDEEGTTTEDDNTAYMGEQARVYKRVCRGFATVPQCPPPLTRQRHLLLTYGQTASGKTHTLFGSLATLHKAERRSRPASPASSGCLGGESTSWWAAQLRSPTAGIVPRFLADLFDALPTVGSCGGGVAVDISCFEIYNEVTTDLVAVFALEEGNTNNQHGRRLRPPQAEHGRGAGQAPHKPPLRCIGRRGTSNASAGSFTGSATHSRGSSVNTGFLGSGSDSEVEDEITVVEVTEDRSLPFPSSRSGAGDAAAAAFSVEVARQRYLDEEAASGWAATPRAAGPPRAAFKATEKGQILANLQRARCNSAVEAWVVMSQLLTLRRRAETERNASSSRGHLLIRVEARCHTGMSTINGHLPPTRPTSVVVSETLFCDLAGSESHRGFTTATATTRSGRRDRASCDPRSRTCGGGNRHSRSMSMNSSVLDSGSFTGTFSEYTDTDSVCSATSSTNSRYSGTRPLGSGHPRIGSSAASSFCFEKTERQQEQEAQKEASERGREMRNINTSLLALRKVIHAFHLVSGAGSSFGRRDSRRNIHAPFKDSALTTVLAPFLLPRIEADGGTADATTPVVPSHAALVVCCSSRQSDFHETVSSLRLGAEASSVKPELVLRAFPQYAKGRGGGSNTTCTETAAERSSRRTHSAPLNSCHREPAQPSRVSVATQTGQPSDGPCAVAATTREAELQSALDTMTEELRTLRRAKTEQDRLQTQLREQFAALCAHYKECVEELGVAKASADEKDALIDHLRSVLHKQQHGRGQVDDDAWDTPWAAGRDVELSPSSTDANERDNTTLLTAATTAAKEEEDDDNDEAHGVGSVAAPLYVRSLPLSQRPNAQEDDEVAEAACCVSVDPQSSTLFPPPEEEVSPAPPVLDAAPMLCKPPVVARVEERTLQLPAAVPTTLFGEVTNRQRDTVAAFLKPPTCQPGPCQATGVAAAGASTTVPTAAPCRVYKL